MKLRSLGYTVDDETMMGKMLSSLLDRFRHFLTAWESTHKSDRTLTNLTARLLAEEARCHTSSTRDNVAFKTVKILSVLYGHIARNCMKKQLRCKICKKDNHAEQNCYFRDRNKSTTSNRDKVAFLTKSMGGNPEGFWVLDSGCTSYMINNSICLTNVTAAIEYQECVLKNVLYVPGLTSNLILAHNITENGGVVKFTDNGVEILKGRTKITREKDNARLYNINLNSSETTLLSESKQTSDLNIWHKRIGHLNVHSMKKLATVSSGLEKLKFGMKRAIILLEIIHTDVCGPLDTTWDGFRYLVTFLDDYTHFSVICLIKNKSDICDAVQNYIVEAESKWNSRVYKLQCGMGGGGGYSTTPAKLWYGKRPDLSNLKLFGSLAYAKKLKAGKLTQRCDKLIMVDYVTNGYRLWNSEKREIKLSRDVTFVESSEVSVL
ncbi:hypothetical protein PR048_013214 [Dryococelus australis]|uniref:GAG-pre-integrase domain-containing protein n=1 Tax=Dryococelus australis TaxID=614101 RepID=A0ABQ9HRV2_9NEOP|nr:hypothetical protein PR048_013214 [Dryococelus australis]